MRTFGHDKTRNIADEGGKDSVAGEIFRRYKTRLGEHSTLNGGVGHNLPQEAPRAFAEAFEMWTRIDPLVRSLRLAGGDALEHRKGS